MQQLLEWTLEAIRTEGSDFSWMEEFRFDWVPLIGNALRKVVVGQTVLILSDTRRNWFGRYIVSHINRPELNRPFVPFYPLQGNFPNLAEIETTQQMRSLEDMLDISYPGGWFLWYIGEGNDRFAKLAYRNDENLLWLFDGQVPNSFNLRKHDPLLDIKLLQLYRLFDRTLEAALFNEVELD
ncbi:HobA family DNA replication regulator [Nitratifractor sp.]